MIAPDQSCGKSNSPLNKRLTQAIASPIVIGNETVRMKVAVTRHRAKTTKDTSSTKLVITLQVLMALAASWS
ncbi:hypothetical protein predicted by Glimmer/Critica [Limosilactobacillus fermentum]|nr:hypothetical protein predicted by Glimmer/Critica [Limosilactobacillus fermentum]